MNKPLTVGFIGLGLIGGSIARALKYYYPDIVIMAKSRSKRTTQYALSEGIIDEAYAEVGEPFSRCDYIFLCAPVEANASYLAQLKPLIKKDCILTDVGSTKTDIHTHIIELDMEANFIGGHPMTGSEKTGVENSKRLLLENAYYIVSPSAKISQEQVEAYVELVTTIKAIPLVLDYREHDMVVAAISHLPHIIAATLVNLVHDEDTDNHTMHTVAAGGFKDITRIASSSPEMWEQICTTNADNIIYMLDAYTASLQTIRNELVKGNGSAINTLFHDSREYRNSFSDLSSGPLKKVYAIYCTMKDEIGGIATLATILAFKGISLRNISIVHNREYEDAVLRVEFYSHQAMKKAIELLRSHNYTVYER